MFKVSFVLFSLLRLYSQLFYAILCISISILLFVFFLICFVFSENKKCFYLLKEFVKLENTTKYCRRSQTKTSKFIANKSEIATMTFRAQWSFEPVDEQSIDEPKIYFYIKSPKHSQVVIQINRIARMASTYVFPLLLRF